MEAPVRWLVWALLVGLGASQLIGRPEIKDNIPVSGSVAKGDALTYRYFSCDGNTPFIANLDVKFGELDLYLWRTVKDLAQPQGIGTDSGEDWFGLAFKSSKYDGSLDESILVPGNLCTKEYVVGVRNTGTYTAQFTLSVRPTEHDLGSLGVEYPLSLNQNCQALFNLSGFSTPGLHALVTVDSTVASGQYDLTMQSALPLHASTLPSASTELFARPTDAVGRSHLFQVVPEIPTGPNRLDVECEGCTESLTLSALGTHLQQPKICTAAGFYGGGALNGSVCSSNSDCENLPTSRLNCSIPDIKSCSATETLSGTFSAKEPNPNCLDIQTHSSLNSATGFCGNKAVTNPGDVSLTLDFGESMVVTGVQTQGGSPAGTLTSAGKWVTSFKLLTSVDGVTFSALENSSALTGNTDETTIVTNLLSSPAELRAVRFVPITYEGVLPVMRVAVVGCSLSGSGSCVWFDGASWNPIPNWRGGCGEHTDCRNATWMSSCVGVQQCNVGVQYGMGALNGSVCYHNEDCGLLPPAHFRCRNTTCQYASDGAQFEDIPWWTGLSCGVDADCNTAVNASRLCGGPAARLSSRRVSALSSSTSQDLSLQTGERRVLQVVSCYESTDLEFNLRGAASHLDSFVSSALQSDTALAKAVQCNGPTCVCQTGSGDAVPGATCGSDSDCQSIASSSFRCASNNCEYLTAGSNWAGISNTACNTTSDCATAGNAFKCANMLTCKLDALWGGAELPGSRCKYDSDCIAIEANRFRCMSNVCEFSADLTSWSSVGLHCSSDSNCTAPRVKSTTSCSKGWEGTYVSLELNNTCTFTAGLVENVTSIRLNETSNMRGTSCLSNNECQQMSNKYFRCNGFSHCDNPGDVGCNTYYSVKHGKYILSPGRCEYLEWTLNGQANWLQVPGLLYPDAMGCDQDFLCDQLRAQTSCNGTVGSCRVADSQGGGSLFLSQCSATQDCTALSTSLFGCDTASSVCQFRASTSKAWLPIPFWNTQCTTDADCAVAATSTCAVGQRCKLAEQFGGSALPGTSCSRASDCVGIPAELFQCNFQSGACQFNGATTADIEGWRGIHCTSNADCRGAQITNTMGCEGHVRLSPPVGSATTYIDVWPRQAWVPERSAFQDVYIDKTTGIRVYDPTQDPVGDNIVTNAVTSSTLRVESGNVWSTDAAISLAASAHPAPHTSASSGLQLTSAPLCHSTPQFVPQQGGSQVLFSTQNAAQMFTDNRLFPYSATSKTTKTQRCAFRDPANTRHCSFNSTAGPLVGTECTKDSHCRTPILSTQNFFCQNNRCAFALDSINFAAVSDSPICNTVADCVSALDVAVCRDSTYCVAYNGVDTWTPMTNTTGACSTDKHCQDLPTANFGCSGFCTFNGTIMPGLSCVDVDDCVNAAARQRYSCWPASLEGTIRMADDNSVTCEAPAFNWGQVPLRNGTVPSSVLPVLEVEEHKLVYDVRRTEAGGDFERFVPFDPPRISRTFGTLATVGVTYFDPSQALNFTLPELGPVDGGNLVSVSGSDFINTKEIVFRFKTGVNEYVNTTGTYVSSTTATFVAPTFPRADWFPLEVAMNTEFFQGLNILYRAIPVPLPTVMAPQSGPVLGGTEVVITGTQYSFQDLGLGSNPQSVRSNIRCRFGETLQVVPSAATLNTIRCTSPRAESVGEHTVYISMNQQHWVPVPQSFLYYPIVRTLDGTCQAGPTTVGGVAVNASILGGSSCNSSASCRNIWNDKYPSLDRKTRFQCLDYAGTLRCQFDAYDGPFDSLPAVLNQPLPEYSSLTTPCAQDGAVTAVNGEWSQTCANWIGASSPVCLGRPACFTAGGHLLRGSDCSSDGDCGLLSSASFRCNSNKRCEYQQLIGVDATLPPLGITAPSFNEIQGWYYTCATDLDCFNMAAPRCNNTDVCSVAPELGGGQLKGLTCASDASCVSQLNSELRYEAINPMTCVAKTCQYRHQSIQGWKALNCTQDSDCSAASVVNSLRCDKIVSIWTVAPEFGPQSKSIPITVTGENIQNTTNLACRFSTPQAAYTVKAVFQSSSRLVCWSPIINASGAVEAVLEVTQDSQLFTTSDIKFHLYPNVSVHSLFPFSGSSAGGTNVTITGANFGDSNSGATGEWLVCDFSLGGRVIGRFLSSTQIVCMSPAIQAVAPVNVTLAVSFSGGADPSVLQFQYFSNDVTVHGTQPQSSNIVGGVTVRLQGTNFIDTGSVAVRVGTSEVPATVISSSELEFTSPVLYSSKCYIKQYCWSESISVEAQGSSVACSTTNRATHSPYGNYTGQLPPFTISGLPIEKYWFNNIKFCSGHDPNQLPSIGCTTEECQLANCTAQQELWRSWLVEEETIRALGVKTVFGRASETCTPISTIELPDGLTSLTPWIEKDLALPADEVGPWLPSRARVLKVCAKLNGQDCTATSATMTYFSTPRITQISPKSGPQVGGTQVTIRGDHFVFLTQQSGASVSLDSRRAATTPLGPLVRFVTRSPAASRVVEATWATETSNGNETAVLHCTVPASPLSLADGPPNALVQVSFNRQDWTTLGDYNFTYFNWPTKALMLEPPFGPIDGGTTVHILGFNWTETGEIQCRFGFLRTGLFYEPNLVNASLLAAPPPPPAGDRPVRQVSCVSPPAVRSFDWALGQFVSARSRTVQLEVSLNSQQFSTSALTYFYSPSDVNDVQGLAVSSVSPSSVSRLGGSTAIISGQSFGAASVYTRVKFVFYLDPTQSVVVTGTVLNETAIRCVTPSITQVQWESAGAVTCSDGRTVSILLPLPSDCSASLRASVLVALDGQSYSQSSVTFYFADTPVLTSIAPLSAAANLATNLTITGSAFASASSLTCRVGGVLIPATAISPAEVHCTIPLYSGVQVGVAQVSVSQDGMTFDANNLSLTITAALPLDTPLSPAVGQLAGGYSVSLVGSQLGGANTLYAIRFLFKDGTDQLNCAARQDPAGLAAALQARANCQGARTALQHLCTGGNPGECSFWCDALDDATAYANAQAAVPYSIVCDIPDMIARGHTTTEKVMVQMTANGKDWVELSNPFQFEDAPNPCGDACTTGASDRTHVLSLGLSLFCILLTTWVMGDTWGSHNNNQRL